MYVVWISISCIMFKCVVSDLYLKLEGVITEKSDRATFTNNMVVIIQKWV